MTEPSYYQRPSAMTEPMEFLIYRRIEELKRKYPEVRQKRHLSRSRFLLAGAMGLVVQDDECILGLLELASMNMTMCRKAME